MISREQAERIRWRLACGEKRKEVARAENVSAGTVDNVAKNKWRAARAAALKEMEPREPTVRCGGCGALLYESVAECLQCKIEELNEQDRQAKAGARALCGNERRRAAHQKFSD